MSVSEQARNTDQGLHVGEALLVRQEARFGMAPHGRTPFKKIAVRTEAYPLAPN